MVEIINDTQMRGIGGEKRQHVIFVAFSVFLKMLGLTVLATSILLWSRVVGFQGLDIQQTYETSEFQGVFLGVLAIVTPLLGVGLWLGMRWALILWGFLGGGILALDYVGQPIDSQMLIFAYTLIILLFLYCLALLVNIWILQWEKKYNIKRNK